MIRVTSGLEMLRKIILAILIINFVSACAERQIYFNVKQPLNTTLEASIGMEVLRVEKNVNLKNIFGKSDIFGRTTKLGFIELRFLGVNSAGKPKFLFTENNTEDKETFKLELILDYPKEKNLTYLNFTIEVRDVSSASVSYLLRRKVNE